MVTPIIQNMAYFLSFHAKVIKKSHWLGLYDTSAAFIPKLQGEA